MAVSGITPALRRAVFLDKDGTLVTDVPYNVDPEKVSFTAGAFEGLHLLQDMGFDFIVVTNQSGVARGCFDEAALMPLQAHLRNAFAQRGLALRGFYYCPHHPDGRVAGYDRQCDCRKPCDGMLRQAASEHGIDLATSWMIGDILNDVEAGRRAGCRTILIDNGNETEWQRSPQRIPDLIASDLHHAAREIGIAETRRVFAPVTVAHPALSD